jgi:uncharacterized protein with HEPN domain
MGEEIKVLLYDILSSISEIESFLADRPKEFENYKNDTRTKRAVERNLEIVGEAMARILKLKKDIEISNSKKIITLRNRIIHGYDTVSDEVIWGIVIKHLPVLKSEVEKLLAS